MTKNAYDLGHTLGSDGQGKASYRNDKPALKCPSRFKNPCLYPHPNILLSLIPHQLPLANSY